MATGKQTSSGSTPRKKAPTDASTNAVTPKSPRRRGQRPARKHSTKTLPVHAESDPVVLADLAIKIIALKGESDKATTNRSGRLRESEMHEAIDDARRLLLSVKGVIDEDVDAYRLFSEDDGLMSFEEIAKRFKSNRWKLMTSRNKVEETVLELIDLAEDQVQKERDKYEALVSVRHRYPGGVCGLLDRVKKQIREMVGNSELEAIISDPDQVAEVMGHYLSCLMGREITEDWQQNLDEEITKIAGIDSFVRYVCGGMTYEQFTPEGRSVTMNTERLACLEFFLESHDAWATSDFKARAKDLQTLMRVTQSRDDVPLAMVGYLKECLKEMRRTPPIPQSVKKVVKSATEELKTFLDRLHLVQVVRPQHWSTLIAQLQPLSGHQMLTGPVAEERMKELHKLLCQTEKSIKKPDFDPKAIRSSLEEIRTKLAETSATLKAPEAELFADEMNKVAESLERGLRPSGVARGDLEIALDRLLTDLKPHPGAKKCRPYELFLFAAQNRLCREELVRKRSSLASGAITGPSRSSSVSILHSHRGAEIALGFGRSK